MSRIFDGEAVIKPYLGVVKGQKQVFHQDGRNIRLLPFVTKYDDNIERYIKEDLKSFDGCIGYCYRDIMKKALPKELYGSKNEVHFKKRLKDAILSNALSITNSIDGNQDKLRSIIESVFFRDDNLVKYGNSAQLYLFWNYEQSGLKNMAEFIRLLFFDAELDQLVRNSNDQKKNVFHELIDRSLPKLGDISSGSGNSPKPYHILDFDVVRKFKEDFIFLHADKGSFLTESEKLLKFYYFVYVSRAAFLFDDFFSIKQHQQYFTLESESVSESRRTNESGWKMLEGKVSKLFSHTVTLDLVNQIPAIAENGTMDYIRLSRFFNQAEISQQDELIEHARQLSELYLKYAPQDVDWSAFDEHFINKVKFVDLRSEFEEHIYKLFCQIDFQFERSSRKSKRNSYGRWFISFAKEYILKNRGRNGYSLNLTNETLLFITKLCVGKQEKMRLKDLWTQFKDRGIYFDDSTRQAILEIYDKINLIEKKSDSGDAQYIRPIL
jgi:DNA phosphorothioation-dependent restriction protein DptG